MNTMEVQKHRVFYWDKKHRKKSFAVVLEGESATLLLVWCASSIKLHLPKVPSSRQHHQPGNMYSSTRSWGHFSFKPHYHGALGTTPGFCYHLWGEPAILDDVWGHSHSPARLLVRGSNVVQSHMSWIFQESQSWHLCLLPAYAVSN